MACTSRSACQSNGAKPPLISVNACIMGNSTQTSVAGPSNTDKMNSGPDFDVAATKLLIVCTSSPRWRPNEQWYCLRLSHARWLAACTRAGGLYGNKPCIVMRSAPSSNAPEPQWHSARRTPAPTPYRSQFDGYVRRQSGDASKDESSHGQTGSPGQVRTCAGNL